jgi:hypothetical protein
MTLALLSMVYSQALHYKVATVLHTGSNGTMLARYGRLPAKLMAKFGGTATIRRITIGAYNPTTGTAAETTSDTVLRGVLEDVNVREVNDLIQSGDKRLTVAAADVAAVPSTADRVLISGVTHQVIRVTTIEQDNTAITHELILRA